MVLVMVKRLTNLDVFDFNHYLVELERVHNDINGNPRFQATIIDNDTNGDRIAYRYKFNGHFYSNRLEADWILKEHLKKVNMVLKDLRRSVQLRQVPKRNLRMEMILLQRKSRQVL